MKIEFIDAPSGAVVGTVLYTLEKRLAIDAQAVLPREGDEVMLPHPHRKVRVVKKIRWRYGKTQTKIEVLLREKHPRKGG